MLIREHLAVTSHLDLNRKGSDGEAIGDSCDIEVICVLNTSVESNSDPCTIRWWTTKINETCRGWVRNLADEC